jgi:hypothetical protein
MEGLSVTLEGAILKAEFFKNSRLCLSQRNLRMSRTRNIHDALKENDFLKRKLRFNRGERLVGEINAIFVDHVLHPSLSYSPIEWVEGKKQYGHLKEIPLEISGFSQPHDSYKWFEFLLDPNARNMYGGFCLYLPPRFYLERQEQVQPLSRPIVSAPTLRKEKILASQNLLI